MVSLTVLAATIAVSRIPQNRLPALTSYSITKRKKIHMKLLSPWLTIAERNTKTAILLSATLILKPSGAGGRGQGAKVKISGFCALPSMR
jgi:hypothetical protein